MNIKVHRWWRSQAAAEPLECGAGREGHGIAPAQSRLPAWYLLAGQLLLLAYVLTRLYTNKPADYAEQLLILLTLGGVVYFRHLLRGAFVTRLFLLALLTQLVTWGLGHWLSPAIAESSPKVERLAAWFFLIPVAMFVPASERAVIALWGTALAVLLLSPWLSGGGWGELAAGLAGGRIDFGLINSQHTGMLFGVAALGLAVFLPRLWGFSRSAGRRWIRFPYILLLAAAVVVVIITQTRAIWVALLVSLFVTLCLFARAAGAERRRRYRARVRALSWRTRLGLAAVGVALIVLGSGIIVERVTHLPSLQPDAGMQDAEVLEDESIRVRLYTWQEAARWIVKRPLFGWGGNGRGEVVKATEGLSDAEHQRFRHLHNTYLGTLVNFGLAGLAVLVGLLWWLTRAVNSASQAGFLSEDFFWFWQAFLFYWLVVNMFESYMYYQTGIFAFSLLAGCYLALVLRAPGRGAGTAPAESTSE